MRLVCLDKGWDTCEFLVAPIDVGYEAESYLVGGAVEVVPHLTQRMVDYAFAGGEFDFESEHIEHNNRIY